MTEPDRSVIFVSQRFPPEMGGNAARIHDLAVHLADQDWDVTVLAPPPCYPPGEFERSWRPKRTETVDGVTVHRLWSWQPRTENPGTVRRLAYYLVFGVLAILWLLRHVRHYDVVVTTTPPISTGAPGLVAAAAGKPWVVDVRDLWIDASISLGYLEEGSPLERVSRRFQRLVLHAADRITVTTEPLGDSLCDEYGESLRSKLVAVPNGVDTRLFRPEADLLVEAGNPESTGADGESVVTGSPDGTAAPADGPQTDGSGRPVIIYTGNLGSAQDLESCIRAMAHLPGDAVLRLVGSGDLGSELRELTDELDLHERVEFAGVVPREEVPDLLNEATIGVAPLKDTANLAYAMPTKVYEYMACGLPTVVTGSGAVRQFVDESGGGVWAENDGERIAERLDALLTDDRRRREFARNGREHVVEHYDRRVIAKRLSDELASLTGAAR